MNTSNRFAKSMHQIQKNLVIFSKCHWPQLLCMLCWEKFNKSKVIFALSVQCVCSVTFRPSRFAYKLLCSGNKPYIQTTSYYQFPLPPRNNPLSPSPQTPHPLQPPHPLIQNPHLPSPHNLKLPAGPRFSGSISDLKFQLTYNCRYEIDDNK